MFASSHFSSVAWIQGENVGVADLSCRNQSEPEVWQLCKQERNLQLRHQINCQDKARRDKWLLIIHIPPGVTWSTNGKEMFDYRGTPSCRVPHLHLHTRPVEKWSRALGSDVLRQIREITAQTAGLLRERSSRTAVCSVTCRAEMLCGVTKLPLTLTSRCFSRGALSLSSLCVCVFPPGLHCVRRSSIPIKEVLLYMRWRAVGSGRAASIT